MCGRFDLHSSSQRIADFLGPRDQVAMCNPRYNQSPGQPILNVQYRLAAVQYHLETYWRGFVPSWAPADYHGPITVRQHPLFIDDAPDYPC